MTLPGRDRAASALVIGSHLNSVPHGGNFDGAAGVLAGLASVAALQMLGVTPGCDIIVMAIRAEESVWFQVSYIGSRGSLGTLPDGALEVRRVDTGRTLADHIASCGGTRQPWRRTPASRPVATASLPGTAYRTGAEPRGSRSAGGDLHRDPRHFPLSGRLDRGRATTMSACPGASAATPPSPAPSSPWRWTRSGGNRRRSACRWAAPSGRFHTDAAQHGMTIVPGRFHFRSICEPTIRRFWRIEGAGGRDRRRHRAAARRALPSGRRRAG